MAEYVQSNWNLIVDEVYRWKQRDGLKIANPLLDVGDMLRSTISKLKTGDKARFSVTQLYPIIDAYHLERLFVIHI